tara:strand:- start:2109 stop:2897 length:789 start_codon:yes stop_codon:yes gene_type:complete
MNDPNYLEALNKYYKFKTKYESKHKKSINTIKDNDSLSLKQKQIKINTIKPKCVKCKRNVGTVFSLENRILSAKCGDKVQPCPLDIQIYKGAIITETEAVDFWQEQINKNKNEMIITKLNFLFNFETEDSSLSKFNELKNTLKETMEEYTSSLDIINQITNSAEKLDSLKTNENTLNKYIDTIKENIDNYITNKDYSILHDTIEIYINNVISLLDTIRNIKYQYINVEYNKDKDVYTLIKNPIITTTIERSIDDPRIISFKI